MKQNTKYIAHSATSRAVQNLCGSGASPSSAIDRPKSNPNPKRDIDSLVVPLIQTKAFFIRRILVASNAIKTIDEMIKLIKLHYLLLELHSTRPKFHV